MVATVLHTLYCDVAVIIRWLPKCSTAPQRLESDWHLNFRSLWSHRPKISVFNIWSSTDVIRYWTKYLKPLAIYGIQNVPADSGVVRIGPLCLLTGVVKSATKPVFCGFIFVLARVSFLIQNPNTNAIKFWSEIATSVIVDCSVEMLYK